MNSLARILFNPLLKTSSSSSAPSPFPAPTFLARFKRYSYPPTDSDDAARHPRQGPKNVSPGPLGTVTGATQDVFGWVEPYRYTLSRKKHRQKKWGFGEKAFQDKPIQKWDEYDGFGSYQYRHHQFPDNRTNRDWIRRRTFAGFAEHRFRVNAVRKAEILPKEIRRLADQEIQGIPRDSAINRLNRRCVITGRPRGIFHQFRVSRFVWRAEADHNKVSGARRAEWMHGIHIDP